MMVKLTVPVITLGISSCLLGDKVRYDGGHKRHSYIEQTLGKYFEFERFCPEMAIGMGVPRDPLRLVCSENQIRCVGVKDASIDVTNALRAYADEQKDWQATLCGYIFKKDSPSCGMERVRVYANEQASRNGRGVFAQRVMENFPELPVEEEGRLGDPLLRENFIQRVYVMHRWQQLITAGVTHHRLVQFHAQHQLIIMSHHQDAVHELGNMIAGNDADIMQVANNYLSTLMACLRTRASRANHVNVLQHIQGYLKKALGADDKAALSAVIEKYRLAELPLIVPITLLKHHFRTSPDAYIDNSYYMNPDPAELCLLNTI